MALRTSRAISEGRGGGSNFRIAGNKRATYSARALMASSRFGTLSASASESIGYSVDELASIPEGADLGLGCGNPPALASLRPGEPVLDLGCAYGVVAIAALHAGGTVTASDLEQQHLDILRQNTPEELRRSDRSRRCSYPRP